jgi:hypothetical protein
MEIPRIQSGKKRPGTNFGGSRILPQISCAKNTRVRDMRARVRRLNTKYGGNHVRILIPQTLLRPNISSSNMNLKYAKLALFFFLIE